MKTANCFYVYILFRPDGRPCYVGKGRGKRINRHFSSAISGSHSNKHLMNIIRKSSGSIPSVIIRNDLSEQEAFEFEIAWIKAIGREAFGGPLVNKTDGGEGPTGFVASEITRQRLSKAAKGRSVSENHKKALALSWLARKEREAREGIKRLASEATRRKMSISRLAAPLPIEKRLETNEKISKALLARYEKERALGNKRDCSSELRSKRVINALGNKNALGHKFTREQSLRMSIAQKRRQAHEKELREGARIG